MITNHLKYSALFSSYYLIVFQTSWLTWSHLMVFAISLNEVLRYESSMGANVPMPHNRVSVNHTLYKQVWSSLQRPSHHSYIHQTRPKRDENEDPGRAYGRGVGFFVGEPCDSTCNKILFHVFCNQSSHICECLPDYPVNVDNKVCLKAVKLGDNCEYREACSYYDINTICSNDGYCQCSEGYSQSVEKEKTCVAGDSPIHLRLYESTYEFFNNADLTTLLSLITSLVMLMFLFCFVIRLFNKARYNDTRASVPPPVILTGLDTAPSRGSSNRSVINEFMPPSRRASYSLLAPPPSNLASRRPSLSSIRSQSSFRSYSSIRSQSSFRNYRGGGSVLGIGIGGGESVRRTISSPVDTMHQISNPTFNTERISQNHYSGTLRNKSETCLIHHSSGINPSVPHH